MFDKFFKQFEGIIGVICTMPIEMCQNVSSGKKVENMESHDKKDEN